MKILFIQHVSALGGSSRSLYELITNLPEDVQPTVLCPKGKYADFLTQKGIKVYTIIGMPQFDNGVAPAGYTGTRWLILLREFFYLPFLFFKILQLKNEQFDIVHVNDITQIYSVIFSRIFLSNHVILHIRASQREKKNFRHKILVYIFKKYVSQIIAIDETVKSTLDNSLDVKVIHNGSNTDNIRIHKQKREDFIVGIVANFQRYKGVLEFIDAANICVNKKNMDIYFHIFGAEYNNTQSLKERVFQLFGFREDMDTIINEKLNKYNLGKHLVLQGYIHNHDEIYNNIDLLAFPSHILATGRPVFESGFYKVPVITTLNNKFNDTMINNVTGLSIEAKNAQALAVAIEKLYNDRELLLSMGKENYNLSHKLYDSKKNSLEIYSIYSQLLHR